MSYILIVDDEAPFRKLMEKIVSAAGFDVQCEASGEAALKRVETQVPALVFLDLKMVPGGLDGLQTLERIRNLSAELPVVLITGYGEVGVAVSAMKLKAFDFLEKPIDLNDVRRILRELFEHTPEGPPKIAFGGLIPASEKFQETLQVMAAAADSSAPILITGESGTGKEVAAEFIHQKSPYSAGPLVKINCSAIPEELLESEMFGVERGAFTGALKSRTGKFELAHKGTLLLDEIGDMKVSLQAKLLRVIQDKQVERLGSGFSRKVDVRILASTNLDLKKQIKLGKFREDLYFRLAVFECYLPPLRERKKDTLPLALYFIKQFSTNRPKRLDSDSERFLINYSWPGNIRELRNAIERSSVLARGGIIRPKHLPPSVLNDTVSASRQDPCAGREERVGSIFSNSGIKKLESGVSIHDIEREIIIEALEANQGNRTQTARNLGMSRRALQYKIKRYKIT